MVGKKPFQRLESVPPRLSWSSALKPTVTCWGGVGRLGPRASCCLGVQMKLCWDAAMPVIDIQGFCTPAADLKS